MRIDAPPLPRLEIRDLRLVLALARSGTTAQAGAILHLTQPAVSRALLAAEERLGTKLFDRTARGLVLTEAGKRLVEGATQVLVTLGELEQRVREPIPQPVRLRLVCECYTAYHWLPSALTRLRTTLPNLEISLAVEHTSNPVRALASGEVDVALLTTAPVPRGPLEQRRAFADEVIFLLSASHPLAERKALTRDDLQAYPLLIGQTPAAEQQWFMTRTFGRRRPRLRIEHLPLTEAIIDVARAGLGIAVLSEWIAAPHLARGDLVVRRLTSGPLERPWRIAWRREHADAARSLSAVLAASAPRGVFAAHARAS